MDQDLLSEVRHLKTLRRVLCWAFARTPPAELVALVTQDEFTHDLIFRVGGGMFLVFDTT